MTFWPAALILSLIFGVSHWKHDTESMLGILFASVFGIAFAWSFRRLGSLSFALGFHAVWNFAQSYIYGVPNSGVILGGSLSRGTMGEPVLLTGGKAGPEGSLLMLGVFVLLVTFIRRLRSGNSSRQVNAAHAH